MYKRNVGNWKDGSVCKRAGSLVEDPGSAAEIQVG